jgi:hypothetical protein
MTPSLINGLAICIQDMAKHGLGIDDIMVRLMLQKSDREFVKAIVIKKNLHVSTVAHSHALTSTDIHQDTQHAITQTP